MSSAGRQRPISGVLQPEDMTSTPAHRSTAGGRLTATRRERQQAEILAAARHDRVSHALDLAFEHLDEFGPDHLVVHVLSNAVAESREPALLAEFDAFLKRLGAPPRR
jgi:hypothetical protein